MRINIKFNLTLIFGLIALTLALIIRLFLPERVEFDFLSGLFTGLSLVFILKNIGLIGRKIRN